MNKKQIEALKDIQNNQLQTIAAMLFGVMEEEKITFWQFVLYLLGGAVCAVVWYVMVLVLFVCF